ncbi:hypothetical protein G5I_07944 [Acromyrmex echinatior]|uniref:Uncharacterized protein n=1 Tax=Acromyrmex echinatior TaxID=103372 RepID=F4WQ08_ACREC|nr:hypothetical protein G5I_07944 [Acromyrmex echinatior]
MRGLSYLLGFLFSNLLSAFVSAYGATGARIVPERDVLISGHKGGYTYCALDLSESLSIEPSRQTLVRLRNVDAISVDGPFAERVTRSSLRNSQSLSSLISIGHLVRKGSPLDDATVQACFATWKIVCKVDDEEDRSDFYPFPSSPSVLRPFHHVSRYANGNQQLPNINGWPSPRGLSHTSIGPFCRTCISINSPACYNQTLNGRLDDRCLLQNIPRGKQCLRDDVGLSTAQPTPSYPHSE